MPSEPLPLDGLSLTLDTFEEVCIRLRPVAPATEGVERARRARGVVDRILEEGRTVYGVSTGFGKFSNVSIPAADLEALQWNLVRSHAVGVGDSLPEPVVRGMMLLKANEILHGHSGAREEVVQALVAALNSGFYPRVPERGSVGASGDLAPLAHVALALVGEGEAIVEGRVTSAAAALEGSGLQPLRLEAKDGLSLINGTQMTTSLLALSICELQRLVKTADIAASLSVDVLMGSSRPFGADIQQARSHPGQAAAAANLRLLLDGSGLAQSHADCGRVQDAYSLRCTPQVHGAAREALTYAATLASRELNACTDNPLVFPGVGGEEDDVVSGGNFHAQIPAHAADSLTLAMTQLAGISERRMERLVNPALSEGLPAFLIREGGLHSGLMMAQVTAGALVSESRTLSNPASAQSISTSADQEDFVSMGPVAGRKAQDVLACASTVVALELLAGCQALDLRRPLRSTEALEAVHACVRTVVPFLEEDRFLARDVRALNDLVRSGEILDSAEAALSRKLS